MIVIVNQTTGDVAAALGKRCEPLGKRCICRHKWLTMV